MNEQSPKLDHPCRDRLGEKLRSTYARDPDPMLPDRLQELVAILLSMEAFEPRPAKSEADGSSGIARRVA